MSEVSQAFCRLSAVFGGVYLLRQPVTALHVAAPASADGPGRLAGVTVGSVRVACAAVVLSQQHALPSGPGSAAAAAPAAAPQPAVLARAVLVAAGSVFPGTTPASEAATLMAVPPGAAGNPAVVNVLGLASNVVVCPDGQCAPRARPGQGCRGRASHLGLANWWQTSSTSPWRGRPASALTPASSSRFSLVSHFLPPSPGHGLEPVLVRLQGVARRLVSFPGDAPPPGLGEADMPRPRLMWGTFFTVAAPCTAAAGPAVPAGVYFAQCD